MKRFGTAGKSCDQDLKAIRRDLDELFDEKGKRGRQPPLAFRDKIRNYKLKPLTTVIQENPNGITTYNFPLLKTVIETITKIKIETLRKEQFFKITEEEFVTETINDDILKLYQIHSSSKLILISKSFCYDTLCQVYALPKFSGV